MRILKVTEENKITGDLRVTGAITADVVHESIILNGTDGSSSNANDNVVIDGTDSSSTNAGDRLIYEEETANLSANTAAIEDNQTDIRLAFLMIAENQGDRLSMNDGIADPFKDESDINTTTSSNESYDSGSDFYVATAPDTLLDLSGLTISADGVGTQNRPTALYDKDTDQAANTQATTWNADATSFAFGVDHGANVTRVVSKVKYYSPNDAPGGIFAAHGGGNLTFTMQGSTDDSTWVGLGGDLTQAFPYSDVSETYEHTMTSTTGYRYHRVLCTKNSGSPGYLRLAEAQMLTAGAMNDMTLVSNAFVADTPPSVGRIHIQVALRAASTTQEFTVNDDLTAEISRDGGTTFTEGTLVLKEKLKDGTFAFEDNNVAIGGQPAGTNMVYRIKTLNEHEIQVHGAVLQWK